LNPFRSLNLKKALEFHCIVAESIQKKELDTDLLNFGCCHSSLLKSKPLFQPAAASASCSVCPRSVRTTVSFCYCIQYNKTKDQMYTDVSRKAPTEKSTASSKAVVIHHVNAITYNILQSPRALETKTILQDCGFPPP
jgi:hypothetical protein